MRFRKRLSAAILAIVMMVSSIQIPGGISYAAEMADSGIESGQNVSVLTAEDTEDTEAEEAKNSAVDGTLTDDDSRTSDDSQTDDGNVAGGDSQPDDGNVAGDDSQPDDGNAAGDDSQPGDDNPVGDDSQPGDDTPVDNGNDSEQEADAGQEMDVKLEPNEKIVSYMVEDLLLFEDMQEVDGGLRSAAYNYSGEVFDYVYRQMMKRVEYIDLYESGYLALKESYCKQMLEYLFSNYTDLLSVKRNYELVLEQVEDLGASVWYVKAIIVHYFEDGEEYGYDLDAFYDKTREALSYVNDEMSDFQKAMVLHDWLAINCSYDYMGYETGNVPIKESIRSLATYTALVDGIAVCEGYTCAYRYLLDLVGVENYYVSSSIMDHAWNLVKLDGKYYHVDVTWDDPGKGESSDGYVHHQYLFCSDDGMSGHEGYKVVEDPFNSHVDVDYSATDTTYDKAFWKEIQHPFFCEEDGFFYYISLSDKKLMKTTFSNMLDPGTEIADSGFDKNPYYYYPLCSSLIKINDRLYYNGEYDIYSIKTDGTDKRTEFTDKVSGRYWMRGIEYREGKIYYHAFDEYTSSWVGWLPSDIDIDIEPQPDNPGEYKIRYQLNGGTNDSGNPDTYNSETETIILKAPTKDGYRFTGWYTDILLIFEVTEITKGSTGNIVLYAGWRPETDNPPYTFTTVDGKKVSSGAEDRPKVLIFFDMSVGIDVWTNGRRMLMDIREHIEAFDGVDLYAIEISGKSSDEVAGFKKMYGCDEITFCYDNDGSNKAYAEEYTNGIKSNLTIVIIDAKNRVQRVTNNMNRNWFSILTDLQEYCGYDDWYWITYDLDGGENDRNNPYIYKNGADDVILKDPFKAGYLFEGWYKDRTFTRKVTKILNDSRENFRLYAKWGRGDGFNAANGYDSYTALDGTKLKSEAEDRPKLLVFYDDAGAESASVIKDIAGIIDELDWVDIYAIDIGQNAKSREKVRQFADTYGCDGITFSYRAYLNTDTESMERYLAKAEIEASTAELPVICYIDAGNLFQWVSLGKVSAADILENLKKYCGYSSRNEGIYKITYKINGGKNDRQNPVSYTSGTKTIILKDPSRTGYTFEGWYKDADYKEKITEITGESTGDITIYAKWSVGLRLNLENNDFTFTALDGTQLSSNAEGRPKLLIFYDVAKDDSASTVRNIADNINVLDGVDIYAINFNKGPINGTYFNANTLDRDYVSKFKDTYGCDGITFAYMSNQDECNLYIYYANTYLQKAGYRDTAISPVLCYIDEENNLRFVSHGKVTVAEVLSCLKNSCGYLGYEGSIYRINYRLDGGTNDSRNPEVYIPGAESIDLYEPFRTCCVFEGWYEDPEFSVQVTQIPKGSTGDITLYVKWKKGIENLDYTFDTLDDETVSSRADGRPKVLFFFRENSDMCKEMSQDLSQYNEYFRGVDIYAIEATLAKKAKVVNFKNDYGCDEITFCYCDSAYDTNWKCLKDYANIAGIDNTIPLTVYIDSQNRVQYAELGQRSYTEVLANLREYCGYRYEDSEAPEKTYKITYVLDGGTNDSANPDTYTSGTNTIVLKDATRAWYQFRGWYKDSAYTQRVTEIPKGSTGDIKLYARWDKEALNAENPYYTFKTLDNKTVNSRADGRPKVLFFFSQSVDYCQNMSLDLSQHIENFNGVDIYAIEVQHATKEEVAQFKNDYGCDEITFCYDTSGTNLQCYYDYEDITRTYYRTVPFAVYIDSQNRVQYAELGGISYTEVLANLRDYCGYRYEDSEGTYNINYKLDGGTNSSENPATYTSETETITLKDAVKEGYTFEGWYTDAAFTENSKLTEIVKGSKGNITLYAKWKKAEMNVSIQKPDKTTYKAGQTLDVTGGKVILTGKSDESVKVERDITSAMISGFDSSAAGICKVIVTCDGYTGSFDTLIIEEPELIASYGQKIKELPLPESDYGTYTWAADVDTEKVLNQTDTQTFEAVFAPNDTDKFSVFEGLQISVAVKTELSPEYVNIECIGGPYTYDKTAIEPEVKVTLSKDTDTDGEEAETLVEGTDYDLAYENNINAGTAKVTVNGINSYYGSMEKTFTIEPKELVIRALEKVVTIGGSIPAVTDYEYDAEGLVDGDELFKAPEFTCAITSTEEEGEYEIIPSNADAGGNYSIRYENGKLSVAGELVTCKVTFDMQGHGTAPTGYTGIQAGSTIDRPADPKAEGYRFDGWYQDAACTKAWNFETDTVQSDITLYAKWLALGSDSDLAVQEIADVYYNGKAQKPAVSVYDQDKLLKAGKDYRIKYYNNINANADGVMSKSGEFNENLPYAEITGKGNYKDSVKINFNILKSSIEDAYGNPAPGVTLKVNDHLVKSAKPLTPFGSIKYGKKLKADTDYELTLTAVNAFDDSGNPVVSGTYENVKIPANYTGEFLLTVKGRGNYTGSITRPVYVADKNHLMKNVKITLGKNLKNVEYTGEEIKFTPAPADKKKPGNDEFVVTCGKTVLTSEVDYSVSYNNNTGVGRAELVVNGKGEYVGKKSVTFNIKGKTFSNGTVTVTGLEDKAYTGKAITQNKEAVLTWKADAKALVYGTDYTISYSKNINKGTATVTFTGMAEGGYSGKVSKKFKITAADISDENQVTRAVSMQAITLPYSKAGVKPVDEIILTSAGGTRLQNGKDYTLKYKNNKAVAAASGDKAPTVTVKGKGNYSGTFNVKFTIERADLNGSGIVIDCTPVAYNSKKGDDYAYKPAVKVKDGKASLKAGKDYEISYEKNTQADYNNYLEKLKSGSATADDKPVAVITEKEGSSYTVQGSIKVPLQIYMAKFKKSNLEVKIDTAVYTGGQVRPNVTVKYKGENGDIPLDQGVDYTLEYGANTASGKNKGSVTVKGLAPDYGGSVTYKFEITRKDLKYWNLPDIDEK